MDCCHFNDVYKVQTRNLPFQMKPFQIFKVLVKYYVKTEKPYQSFNFVFLL